MTTLMHHSFYDSPSTQASFEAFINQSPQSLSEAVLTDEPNSKHASELKSFSPQLPRSYLNPKMSELESAAAFPSSFGHNFFAAEYSSSAGSDSTPSSHNAGSPHESSSSHSSLTPDLGMQDPAQFDALSASSPKDSTHSGSKQLLDFDIDLPSAVNVTVASNTSLAAAAPSNHPSIAHHHSGMWAPSSQQQLQQQRQQQLVHSSNLTINTSIAAAASPAPAAVAPSLTSEPLLCSPVDGVNSTSHSRTSSMTGALSVNTYVGEPLSQQDPWYKLSADLNVGATPGLVGSAAASGNPTIQPLVLNSATASTFGGVHNALHLAPAIHSAPANMAHSFDLGYSSLMPNHGSGAATGHAHWQTPSVLTAGPPHAGPLSTVGGQTSMHSKPMESTLLTSAYVPPTAATPMSAGNMTTFPAGTQQMQLSPQQQQQQQQQSMYNLLPSSAPAQISTFSAQQIHGVMPMTPTPVGCGMDSAMYAPNGLQQEPQLQPIGLGLTTGPSSSAASASMPIAVKQEPNLTSMLYTSPNKASTKPSSNKRKRKADESEMQDGSETGSAGRGPYAQMQQQQQQQQQQQSSAAAATAAAVAKAASLLPQNLRDRKPLPKRPPPSAFQKTEAGLPFPVVDTSVKHSTLFVPPDTTGLTKREARLVKNRAAAFLSRQRKREQFDELEVRCHALSRLAWRMYETLVGDSEVEWSEAAARLGLAPPSGSTSSLPRQQQQQPQSLGHRLREEPRAVISALEMVVGRKGASIGPLEGELPLDQGPPLGPMGIYVPSQHLSSEPRLAANMMYQFDAEESPEGCGESQASQSQSQQSGAGRRKRHQKAPVEVDEVDE
ncbi:hypothetical protein OC861_002248 [Tilletia horrida]|nr:hypothetical protein OC861_002248 [Tilletia horrida]